jgi:hypothetical protein
VKEKRKKKGEERREEGKSCLGRKAREAISALPAGSALEAAGWLQAAKRNLGGWMGRESAVCSLGPASAEAAGRRDTKEAAHAEGDE